MNIESLVIESQEIPPSKQADGSEPQQPAEITPLPPECFHLVGGGDAIVVL